MSEELAIKIFKQASLTAEVAGCVQCPRKNEMKHTCISCLDNAKESLLDYIEQLQQENQRLKQWDKNKDSRNSRQRVANAKLIKENEELKEKEKFKSCGFSASIKELYRLATVLDEFEKWLEEKIKCTEQYADNDMAKGYINAIKLCKYYLQELKEGKK